MKKLNWLFIFFGLVIIVSCEKKKSTSHHPNVILIISDQWSTRSLTDQEIMIMVF